MGIASAACLGSDKGCEGNFRPATTSSLVSRKHVFPMTVVHLVGLTGGGVVVVSSSHSSSLVDREASSVTRRQTAAATILGTPAILQNRSPCLETGIQANSSNEVGYLKKTECELSPSPQKSDAASSGSSPITETSSPTSSSSWSHNTPTSSLNTFIEESSPEQKEQGSSSPLVTDDRGTSGKAALSTPQAEGEKQVFLLVPSTPLSRPSNQLCRDVNKSSASRETQSRPLARNSCVLGPPRNHFLHCHPQGLQMALNSANHRFLPPTHGRRTRNTKTRGFNPKIYPTLSATCEPWVHFPAGDHPLQANRQEKLLSVCDTRGNLRAISGS
ncbi:hypothetical protein HPB51_011457 [Rhipicephalus microplus]|uniref:Uncharacterized protein n=1 Tax=Rhipicephalus microplus TaxID=6941 RepID=A0A9J6DUE8_RHIMP|nr:hypothetical protein HPB51_011457 [Rhipicephalus microplus]